MAENFDLTSKYDLYGNLFHPVDFSLKGKVIEIFCACLVKPHGEHS